MICTSCCGQSWLDSRPATVARHCGLRVTAVSAITNLAEGLSDVPLSHEQTLRDGQRAAADLSRLLLRFLERIGGGDAGR